MEFKQVLKRRRKALGLTQKQVAEWFGIRDVNVSDWERGDTLPETGRLTTLAKKLNLSISELMGEITPADQRLQGHQVDHIRPVRGSEPEQPLNLVKVPGDNNRQVGEMGLMWISPWEIRLITECRLTDEQGRDAIMTAAQMQPKPLATLFGRDKTE